MSSQPQAGHGVEVISGSPQVILSPPLPVCSARRISLLVNDRDIVAPEKVVESAREQRLRILAGLGLHQSQAAFEASREIGTNMYLPTPAWRSGRLNLLG
jgi:hypothetical protein